jgi:hypothetical protein
MVDANQRAGSREIGHADVCAALGLTDGGAGQLCAGDDPKWLRAKHAPVASIPDTRATC